MARNLLSIANNQGMFSALPSVQMEFSTENFQNRCKESLSKLMFLRLELASYNWKLPKSRPCWVSNIFLSPTHCSWYDRSRL